MGIEIGDSEGRNLNKKFYLIRFPQGEDNWFLGRWTGLRFRLLMHLVLESNIKFASHVMVLIERLPVGWWNPIQHAK